MYNLASIHRVHLARCYLCHLNLNVVIIKVVIWWLKTNLNKSNGDTIQREIVVFDRWRLQSIRLTLEKIKKKNIWKLKLCLNTNFLLFKKGWFIYLVYANKFFVVIFANNEIDTGYIQLGFEKVKSHLYKVIRRP